MEYKYTDLNRIESPNNYMYANFSGEKFIETYQKNRLSSIVRFKNLSQKSKSDPKDIFFCYQFFLVIKDFLGHNFNELEDIFFLKITNLKITEKGLIDSSKYKPEPIESFKVKDVFFTENLLSAIIFCQFNGSNRSLVKYFLELLIRSFEVQKKVYEKYSNGVINGNGASNIVYIYWLFSLSLSIFYIQNKDIKYLNTLLKISDLLCSLDDDLIDTKLHINGLILVVFFESNAIKLLLNNYQESNFDFA